MKTINVFEYEELSKEAQEKAIKKMREMKESDTGLYDFFFQDEMQDCYKCIVEYLGAPNEEENDLEFFKRKMWAKGYDMKEENPFNGICAFTGICFDDDLLEEIYKNLNKGDSLSISIGKLDKFIENIVDAEIEYLLSKEGLEEDAENFLFFKNGSLVPCDQWEL